MHSLDLNWLSHQLETEFPLKTESIQEHPQTAAVLVLLFPKAGKPHVLLIKRADHLRNHAGEISFPGGVYEAQDETLLGTALRETREELNLDVAPARVRACLPTVSTLTGYEVTPFVAVLDSPPRYIPNPNEVEEVLEVPLIPLLATHQRDIGHHPDLNMVAYWYLQHRIWGATAKILNQIGRTASLL